MKTFKFVPLGPALIAAGDVITATGGPETPDAKTFRAWFSKPAYPGHRGLIDDASLLIEQTEIRLSEVPSGPIGDAWKATAQACLDRTSRDVLRPYDQFEFDTDREKAAKKALQEYAEKVREDSPLLEDVADVLMRVVPWGRMSFTSLHEDRRRVTKDGIVLGTLSECEKHGEGCIPPTATTVPWAQLNALSTGIQTRTRFMVTALDKFFPEVGENDQMTFRRGEAVTEAG